MENKINAEETASIGCIVGRFQVHELHKAHRDLIDGVVKTHKKAILFLGVPRTLGTKKNPLDFTTRRRMIQAYYPDLNIASLPDQRYNDVWSKNLDARIKEIYPTGSVVLYGGRDSFIPAYTGIHDTKELEQTIYVSGTEIRKNVSEEIKATPEWRAGVIYGCNNRYDTSFQAVDIAPFENAKKERILLCKKPGEKGYRFIGGMVDPKDISLEDAISREFNEESGYGQISNLKYVTSHRVKDWRYENETDKIMTALYEGYYVSGELVPSDDISELQWFSFPEFFEPGFIEKTIIEEHIPLMVALVVNNKNK